MQKIDKIKVFYDGLCSLCSREIKHYSKQDGCDKIEFIDITTEGFKPIEEGLDPYKVNKYMHAKDQQGEVKVKVEAFRLIWSVLPKYSWLVKYTRLPLVRQLLDFGYEFFALARPYLPKLKRSTCSDSPYCS